VDHSSAYETIDPSEAFTAWRTLTQPPNTKEVRPTYMHTSVSDVDSIKTDYEKFIEFHNSKKKKEVPERVKKRIERDAEDIFSWLSQQHGMWITHIELEYMVEASVQKNPSDLYAVRDRHKGACSLKAVNFVEYVKCATSRPDAEGGAPSYLPMMMSQKYSQSYSSSPLPSPSSGSSGNLRRKTNTDIRQTFTSKQTKIGRKNMLHVIQHASHAATAVEMDYEDDAFNTAPSLHGFGDNLQIEPTTIPRTTVRGRVLVAEAGPRAWSDIVALRARRPMARTVQEEDLALELGATGDMLSSTRKINISLLRRVRKENKMNQLLEQNLKQKTMKCNELGRYKEDVDTIFNEKLKNEKTLRQQATWDAADANKKMSEMTLRLEIAEKRLYHHMEQEGIRLSEEKAEKDQKDLAAKRDRKKMIALEALESALNIKHVFEDSTVKKKRNKGNKDAKSSNSSPKTMKRSETVPDLKINKKNGKPGKDRCVSVPISDDGKKSKEEEELKITSNEQIMEQISRLRIAISNRNTQFGTKLGILNDLFNALDLVGQDPGDGAVATSDFLIAMEHVGLKGKKDRLMKLVEALDVDGVSLFFFLLHKRYYFC